jgi:hypothetical protein
MISLVLKKIIKLCIFVYYIDENNQIVKERDGNPNYFAKDVIYLLRIENEENITLHLY